MDQETSQKIKILEEKIDAIYISVEKTRKYFLWTMIGTIIVFVLPILALAIVVPSFLSNYTSTLNTLGQ